MVADLEAKRAKGAAMLSDGFAIEIHVGNGASGFEANEVTPARAGCGEVKLAAVPARAAQVVFAILRLFPAPAMRKGNRLPGSVVEVHSLGAGRVTLFEPPVSAQRGGMTRGGV